MKAGSTCWNSTMSQTLGPTEKDQGDVHMEQTIEQSMLALTVLPLQLTLRVQTPSFCHATRGQPCAVSLLCIQRSGVRGGASRL